MSFCKFPYTQELNRITISHPICDHTIGIDGIFHSRNIRHTDIINIAMFDSFNGNLFYDDVTFLCYNSLCSKILCKGNELFWIEQEKSDFLVNFFRKFVHLFRK